jgi:hypothetical protein
VNVSRRLLFSLQVTPTHRNRDALRSIATLKRNTLTAEISRSFARLLHAHCRKLAKRHRRGTKPAAVAAMLLEKRE